MKQVLVTGAGGLLGAYVVDALLPDYAVTSLDRCVPAAPIPHVDCDILDLAAVRRAVKGMDSVIHIAAAANIHSGPAERIIDVNLRGAWNILEAAFEAGVRRVVLCSSDSVMGNTVWKDYFWKPLYLPVDEAHPVRPADPYGLSKLLAEEAGRSFAARGVMAVVALRPVFILFPSMVAEAKARHRDPENYAGPVAGGHVGAGGGLCWHHIDPRDVASAFRLALEYDYRGFECFYLSARSTLFPEPTLARVEAQFGDVPKIRNPGWYESNPFAPMFDIRKAQNMLGWSPAYDHRNLIIAAA